MESLNYTLFALLNAPSHPGTLAFAIALFFAEYAIFLIPAALVLGWLQGSEPARKAMLGACLAGLSGLLINQIIGLAWQHPRPFMIGLGHTLISHAPDSSFPSDHLTLLWSAAFSLFLHRSSRRLGLMLTLLGLPVAWARIYLGVHFPLDMLGACLVSILSAGLIFKQADRLMPSVYGLSVRLYRRLFGRMIRRGWVRA